MQLRAERRALHCPPHDLHQLRNVCRCVRLVRRHGMDEALGHVLSRRRLLGVGAAAAALVATRPFAGVAAAKQCTATVKDTDISIQLFTTLLLANASPEATLTALREIGYTKVEHAGFGSAVTAANFRTACDNAGIKCTSGHMTIGHPYNDTAWKTTVEDALTVGQIYINAASKSAGGNGLGGRQTGLGHAARDGVLVQVLMDRVGERGNTMRRVGAVTIIVLAVAALGGVAGAQVNIDPLKVEREVLTQEVADPTQIEVAPDGRVIIGEREGAIKVWRQDGTLIESGRIPVAGNACASCPDKLLEEGGLHGLLLDRNFMRTGKIYVHYSVPGSRKAKTQEGKFRIATFVLRKDKLDLKSRKTILEIPAEWDHCCHYGGDMTWMKDGTILLSVGDDSSPREDMYNPRDKRKGRRAFDADRTAGNPRDLRGKILRFTATGGVPKNNPHVGDKRYNPYVYAMRVRIDYRISYAAVTGAVYVATVGPDAYGSDPNRGPAGMDELETIPPGGGTNHGWPRCIGNNTPYMDYDYASGESKGPLSCKGMTPATIYIPYGPSEEFPGMGLGPRTLMSGPPYRYTGKGALQLDGAFQGKLIFWDFMRGVFWTAPIGDKGKLDTAQITSFHFHAPNMKSQKMSFP